MKKYFLFFICGLTIHLCTSTKSISDGLFVRREKCVCYGKFLFLDCQLEYLALVELSLGFVYNPGLSTSDCLTNVNHTCPQVNANCIVPYDNNDKLELFQRFSAYTRSLNLEVGKRQWLPKNCISNRHTNYGKFDYTCIKENSMLDICSPFSMMIGKIVYIRHYTTEHHNSSSCKCTAQPKLESGLKKLTLLAVDIRLTSSGANCTGNHSIYISNEVANRTIHCESKTVIGEYSEVFTSTTGNMSIDLNLDEDGDLPESVWMAIVGDSGSEVTVECGTKPPGWTYSPSSTRTTTTRRSNIMKTSRVPVQSSTNATSQDVDEADIEKHCISKESTAQKDSFQSLDKSVKILVYTCVAFAGLVSLTVTGVCLKMRMTRRKSRKQSKAISIETLPGSGQSSGKINNGFSKDNKKDGVY